MKYILPVVTCLIVLGCVAGIIWSWRWYHPETIVECPSKLNGGNLLSSKTHIRKNEIVVECIHWPALAGKPNQRTSHAN